MGLAQGRCCINFVGWSLNFRYLESYKQHFILKKRIWYTNLIGWSLNFHNLYSYKQHFILKKGEMLHKFSWLFFNILNNGACIGDMLHKFCCLFFNILNNGACIGAKKKSYIVFVKYGHKGRLQIKHYCIKNRILLHFYIRF